MSKNTHLRALLLLAIAIFSLLVLSGCDKAVRPTVQEGIEIENEALSPYTDEASALADGVISSLISYYHTATDATSPEASVLAQRATRLQKITEEHLLPEDDYLHFMRLLREKGPLLIDEIVKLRQGETLDFALWKEWYLALTELTGTEYLADLLHSLSLFLYDAKYKDAMHLFNTTGNVNQKVKAQKYQAERTVFSENIDKADTRVLLSTLLFFGDLTVGGAFDEGAMMLFSDEEILLFLKHVDLSELSVGKDGWALLFDYAASYIGEMKVPSYSAKLFWAAAKNKNYSTGKTDAELLAERMPTLLHLLCSAQEGLLAEDVMLIREGDGIGILENALSRMNEEERSLFLSLCELAPNRRAYEAVAVQYFGDAYTAYAESATACTAEELLTSVGTQNFRKTFEGFLASLSPAFSILMTED